MSIRTVPASAYLFYRKWKSFQAFCLCFSVSQGSNQRVMSRIGQALFEAFIAYNDGQYELAVEKLLPVRYEVTDGLLSGSRAQVFLLCLSFLLSTAVYDIMNFLKSEILCSSCHTGYHQVQSVALTSQISGCEKSWQGPIFQYCHVLR